MILVATGILFLILFVSCLVFLHFSGEKPKGAIFLLLVGYVGAIVIPAGFAGIPAAIKGIWYFHYQRPDPELWSLSVLFLLVMVGIIVGCAAWCIVAIKHRPAVKQLTR